MSGSGNPVGGVIQTGDDGRSIILPGETASERTVFGLQGVDVIVVSVRPPTDASWEVNRRETELVYHFPQQRATDL